MPRRLTYYLTPLLLAAGVVAGFAREITLVTIFGLSAELDIIRSATILPSLFTQTMGTAIVFALVPYLVRGQLDTSLSEARRNRLGIVLPIAISIGIFLLGLATVPAQARYLGAGFDDPTAARLLDAMYIAWFIVPLIAASLGLRALYYSMEKSFAGATATLAQAAGFTLILLAAWRSGWLDTADPRAVLYIYVAGGLIVLTVHLLALDRPTLAIVRQAFSRPLDVNWTILKPLVLGLLTSMSFHLLMGSPRLFDLHFMSRLDAGAIAAVEFSYAIIIGATIIVANSTNIMVVPAFNRALGGGRGSGYIRVLSVCCVILTAFGFLASGFVPNLLELVFGGWLFDQDELASVGSVLGWQVCAFGLIVFNAVAAQLLLGMARYRLLIGVAIAKAATKYVIGSALLETFRIESAGISLLAAEIVMTACFAAALLAHLRRDKSRA